MLKVGSSCIDITPTKEVYLGGTAELRKTNKIYSRLYVNTAIIDDGIKKILFISLDLLWLNDLFIHDLKKHINKKFSIPETAILICCTHTHNAPSVSKILPNIPVDIYILDLLKIKIISSIENAYKNIESVIMGYFSKLIPHSFNRRTIVEGNILWMGASNQDPPIIDSEGPSDQELISIWFKNNTGKVKTVIVNYSAHPNNWCFDNIISSDYPGEIKKALNSHLNQDTAVLFLQGCCGNTGIKNYQLNQYNKMYDPIEDAIRTGENIAYEIIKNIHINDNYYSNHQYINFTNTSIDVPKRKINISCFAKAKETLKKVDTSKKHTYTGYNPKEWELYWANSILALKEDYINNKTYNFNFSIFAIGNITVITNPAEMFVEFQLCIKKELNLNKIIVAELTNGYCGYVPTQKSLKNGGYETNHCLSSYLEPVTGEYWVSKSIEEVNKLNI